MLLRWAQTADASGLANSAAKAYLGAVVVWLHAGDAAQAGAVYQVRTPPACHHCRPQEGRTNAWLHAGGPSSPRRGWVGLRGPPIRSAVRMGFEGVLSGRVTAAACVPMCM